MRTRFALSTAVLTTLAMGVMLLGPGVASAGGKGKHTLRLIATENQFEFVDLGAPGPSLGDELVFSETLSRRGRDVGESGVVCVVTEAVPPYDVLTFHCVATLKLRNGQITLQGLIEVQGEEDPGPFTVAITGGTGRFRGAGGEARIRQISDTMSVYKLRFDAKKHKNHKKHRT